MSKIQNTLLILILVTNSIGSTAAIISLLHSNKKPNDATLIQSTTSSAEHLGLNSWNDESSVTQYSYNPTTKKIEKKNLTNREHIRVQVSRLPNNYAEARDAISKSTLPPLNATARLIETLEQLDMKPTDKWIIRCGTDANSAARGPFIEFINEL